MFSLVLTIIGIALVAALSLATLYYGGDVFTRSNSDAEATRIKNEGEQIIGAMILYRADHEGAGWPTRSQLLTPDPVTGKTYLKSWPQTVAEASPVITTALADGGIWTIVPGFPAVKFTTGVSEDTCRSVNKLSRGDTGILTKLSTSYSTQCYSASTGYTVIIAQTPVPEALLAADGNIDNVIETEAPLDDLDNDLWAKKPTTVRASGALSLNSVLFEATQLGQVYSKEVVVTNTGRAASAIEEIFLSQSLLSSNFTISADTCSGQLLIPSDSCTITIEFSPLDRDSHTGVLSIRTPNDSRKVTSVQVHGAAIVSNIDPELEFSTAALDMTTSVGVPVSQSVVITNSGNVTLTGMGTSITGAGYSVEPNCPSELVAGSSCTVEITALFNEEGPIHIGTFTVHFNEITESIPLNTVVTASATAPEMNLSSNSLNFLNILRNTLETRTIVITNYGTAPLKNIQATVADSNKGFSVNGCAADVGPTESCTLTVSVNYAASGLFEDSMTVAATGVASQSVSLRANVQEATEPSGESLATLVTYDISLDGSAIIASNLPVISSGSGLAINPELDSIQLTYFGTVVNNSGSPVTLGLRGTDVMDNMEKYNVYSAVISTQQGAAHIVLDGKFAREMMGISEYPGHALPLCGADLPLNPGQACEVFISLYGEGTQVANFEMDFGNGVYIPVTAVKGSAPSASGVASITNFTVVSSFGEIPYGGPFIPLIRTGNTYVAEMTNALFPGVDPTRLTSIITVKNLSDAPANLEYSGAYSMAQLETEMAAHPQYNVFLSNDIVTTYPTGQKLCSTNEVLAVGDECVLVTYSYGRLASQASVQLDLGNGQPYTIIAKKPNAPEEPPRFGLSEDEIDNTVLIGNSGERSPLSLTATIEVFNEGGGAIYNPRLEFQDADPQSASAIVTSATLDCTAANGVLLAYHGNSCTATFVFNNEALPLGGSEIEYRVVGSSTADNPQSDVDIYMEIESETELANPPILSVSSTSATFSDVWGYTGTTFEFVVTNSGGGTVSEMTAFFNTEFGYLSGGLLEGGFNCSNPNGTLTNSSEDFCVISVTVPDGLTPSEIQSYQTSIYITGQDQIGGYVSAPVIRVEARIRDLIEPYSSYSVCAMSPGGFSMYSDSCPYQVHNGYGLVSNMYASNISGWMDYPGSVGYNFQYYTPPSFLRNKVPSYENDNIVLSVRHFGNAQYLGAKGYLFRVPEGATTAHWNFFPVPTQNVWPSSNVICGNWDSLVLPVGRCEFGAYFHAADSTIPYDTPFSDGLEITTTKGTTRVMMDGGYRDLAVTGASFYRVFPAGKSVNNDYYYRLTYTVTNNGNVPEVFSVATTTSYPWADLALMWTTWEQMPDQMSGTTCVFDSSHNNIVLQVGESCVIDETMRFSGSLVQNYAPEGTRYISTAVNLYVGAPPRVLYETLSWDYPEVDWMWEPLNWQAPTRIIGLNAVIAN